MFREWPDTHILWLPDPQVQGWEQRGWLVESELPALSDIQGTICLACFPSERVSNLVI